jgi:hypothetical protein
MSAYKKMRFGRVLWLIVCVWFGWAAVFLLWCAIHGLIVDDVYLQGSFISQRLHVHGVTAWFGAGIDICLAALFISFIVRCNIDRALRHPFFRSFDKWLKYIVYGLVAGLLVAVISTVHKR